MIYYEHIKLFLQIKSLLDEYCTAKRDDIIRNVKLKGICTWRAHWEKSLVFSGPCQTCTIKLIGENFSLLLAVNFFQEKHHHRHLAGSKYAPGGKFKTFPN